MGFFSWFSSCGTVGEGEGDGRSLIHINVADPKLSEVQRRAAEDVARVQQDDKYFHRDDDDDGGGL
jgi:hypothetical protein